MASITTSVTTIPYSATVAPPAATSCLANNIANVDVPYNGTACGVMFNNNSSGTIKIMKDCCDGQPLTLFSSGCGVFCLDPTTTDGGSSELGDCLAKHNASFACGYEYQAPTTTSASSSTATTLTATTGTSASPTSGAFSVQCALSSSSIFTVSLLVFGHVLGASLV